MKARSEAGPSDAQAVHTSALAVRKLGPSLPRFSSRAKNRGRPPDQRTIDPAEMKTRGSTRAGFGLFRRSS